MRARLRSIWTASSLGVLLGLGACGTNSVPDTSHSHELQTQPCTTAADCSNGQVCISGACAACVPSGGACQASTDCCAGTCSGANVCSAVDSGVSNVVQGPSVPSLFFAVLGDTRPATEDDTSKYPTAIITQLYGDIKALSPAPQFSVSTGDYMFAVPGNGQAAPQATLYMQAEQQSGIPFYPVMGNHECAGANSSNCGPNGTSGVTENYQAFLNVILGGAGLPNALPYYSVNLSSSDPTNPWTAKFVMIAANAWDSGQAAWLSAVMAQQTTYTFVVRHEPYEDNSQCIGCGGSDDIVKTFPYTMLLVGHEHTYRTAPARSELVVGLGGATRKSTMDVFGYVTCQQRTDGDIQCNELDYNSNSSSYPDATMVVTPTGQAAQ